MSIYLEKAKELRAITEVHYNCAQSVIVPFAELAGLTEQQAYRTAANFGSGMKMAATCGAITGGLMALGLAGIDDAKTVNSFFRKVRNNHDGLINCSDLLRTNAEKGGVKGPHCDAMVCECVGYVEELLSEKGVL